MIRPPLLSGISNHVNGCPLGCNRKRAIHNHFRSSTAKREIIFRQSVQNLGVMPRANFLDGLVSLFMGIPINKNCENCGRYFRPVLGLSRHCSHECCFISKMELDENGCWIWKFCILKTGYASFRHFLGHRWMYEFLNGPIPKTLQIDHLCRVRSCVNPNHMRLVTIKENVLCGIGITAVNKTKTHCVHGHEFTEENTFHYKGHRACKICRGRSNPYLGKMKLKNKPKTILRP